jgi:hypothetical protein
MIKFIEINGILRAPAYIGNVYYMGGEKITMNIGYTAKKSLGPEVVDLDKESEKLVADAIKELAKEAKSVKADAPAKPAAPARSRKPAAKPAASKPVSPVVKPHGEIPLV